MDTSGEFSRRLKELNCQLRNLTAAAEELGPLLDQCAMKVLQRDQAFVLSNLSTRIMREVEDVRAREVAANDEFNAAKHRRGAITFLGGAVGAALGRQKDPWSRGAELMQPVLDQKAPFGAVMVAIAKEGLPDGVKVVPLSQLARESKKSQQEIRVALEERDCLLMIPETFARLTDNLKAKVMDGSMSLPIGVERIATELKSASAESQPALRVLTIS